MDYCSLAGTPIGKRPGGGRPPFLLLLGALRPTPHRPDVRLKEQVLSAAACLGEEEGGRQGLTATGAGAEAG